MAKHVLLNCFLIFLCIFLMCPKRTRLQVASSRQQFNPKSRRTGLPGWRRHWLTENLPMRRHNLDKNTPVALSLSQDQIAQMKLWPTGVIPYFIDDVSYSDKVLRDKIRLVLNEVNSETGITFMEMATPPPKEDKMRWVFFINRAARLGCGDHSIRDNSNEGVQKVILGYDCMSTGNEIAEAVLAIVGIPPQHNAPNRDAYIDIHKDNIIPDKQYLFEKVSDNQWPFKNLEYDFESAGHYHHHKYSANGKATITLKDNETDVTLGETNGFSSLDLKKMKMVYKKIAKNNKAPECEKLFARKIALNKKIEEDSLKDQNQNHHVGENIPGHKNADSPNEPNSKNTGINNDNVHDHGNGDNIPGDLTGEPNVENTEMNNGNQDRNIGDNMPGHADENKNSPNEPNDENMKINNGDEASAHDDRQKNEKQLNEKNNEHTDVRQTLKGKLSKHVDPFSVLSDYRSGERKKRMLKRQGVKYLKYKRLNQPR